MNTLHNPNCLLSPTHHHIYNCEGDTCTCKFCNTKQEHLITYIDLGENKSSDNGTFQLTWNLLVGVER